MKATQTVNITEQDRATARRVIRRQAGARGSPALHIYRGQEAPMLIQPKWGDIRPYVSVGRSIFEQACEAAALGRAYGKALGGAR